jgi:hypothetical protein
VTERQPGHFLSNKNFLGNLTSNLLNWPNGLVDIGYLNLRDAKYGLFDRYNSLTTAHFLQNA